ncbi:MAG: hypothetical protein WEE89_15085 [Gemmatimonadota bacterium]
MQIGFRGSDFNELLSGLELGDRVVLGPASACENTPRIAADDSLE